MTFSVLVSRTAHILECDAEDEATVALLKQAINEAYLTNARDKWRPALCEAMDVCEGRVPLAHLSEAFISLKRVTDVSGNTLTASVGKDFLHIAAPDARVLVTYFFLPHPMEADDEEPILPAAQVDPYAYIYFAASLYLNIKHRHNDAAVWDIRYRNVTDNIREGRSGVVLPKPRWR